MKTTFYLQFEAVKNRYYPDKLDHVDVRRVTKLKPGRPIPNCVVVKMTVDIPEQAFLPLEPVVDIEIPLDRTVPVRVTVEEPDLEEREEA